MKPKAPIGFSIIGYAYYASLWAYPISEGGVANLSAFYAWGFSGFCALFGAIVVFCVPAEPSKYRKKHPALRVLGAVATLGGIAWLVWNGSTGLAAVALFGSIMAWMQGMKEKQAEERT